MCMLRIHVDTIIVGCFFSISSKPLTLSLFICFIFSTIYIRTLRQDLFTLIEYNAISFKFGARTQLPRYLLSQKMFFQTNEFDLKWRGPRRNNFLFFIFIFIILSVQASVPQIRAPRLIPRGHAIPYQHVYHDRRKTLSWVGSLKGTLISNH